VGGLTLAASDRTRTTATLVPREGPLKFLGFCFRELLDWRQVADEVSATGRVWRDVTGSRPVDPAASM
jgi:hypothetical protein